MNALFEHYTGTSPEDSKIEGARDLADNIGRIFNPAVRLTRSTPMNMTRQEVCIESSGMGAPSFDS